MGRLANKVALITGGARGNAEAIALRYAAEGADIVTCDVIPAEELDNTTGKAVRAIGRRALCVETDVSDESQVNDMVETALAEFGKIDICVHVVGIAGPTQDIQHLRYDEWRNVLAVNVDSAFLVCRAVLPNMIERQTGRIILFSSATGKQPLPHRSPYAASKMGIIGDVAGGAVDVATGTASAAVSATGSAASAVGNVAQKAAGGAVMGAVGLSRI